MTVLVAELVGSSPMYRELESEVEDWCSAEMLKLGMKQNLTKEEELLWWWWWLLVEVKVSERGWV